MSTLQEIKLSAKTRSGFTFKCERYDSAMQVAEDCKHRRITSSSFDNMGTKDFGSWEGVRSYAEALDLLQSGYQPTVDKLKKQLTMAKAGNGKRITFKNDIVGYSPIVPLAIIGAPENMLNHQMKTIKAKVIDVYYDMTCSCGVDSDNIIKAGCQLLSVIIDLEQQGYRFNLYAVQSYADQSSCDMLIVKVKSSTQPIDLKRISFPLTHTGFFRVIGFDWYSKCPTAKYRSAYGHALSYEFSGEKKLGEVAHELFGENAVLFLAQNVLHKGEEHFKEVILNASGNKNSSK